MSTAAIAIIAGLGLSFIIGGLTMGRLAVSAHKAKKRLHRTGRRIWNWVAVIGLATAVIMVMSKQVPG